MSFLAFYRLQLTHLSAIWSLQNNVGHSPNALCYFLLLSDKNFLRRKKQQLPVMAIIDKFRFSFLSPFPLMKKDLKIEAKRNPPALPRSQAVLSNQCLSLASLRRREGKRQAALQEPLCFLSFTPSQPLLLAFLPACIVA